MARGIVASLSGKHRTAKWVMWRTTLLVRNPDGIKVPYKSQSLLATTMHRQHIACRNAWLVGMHASLLVGENSQPIGKLPIVTFYVGQRNGSWKYLVGLEAQLHRSLSAAEICGQLGSFPLPHSGYTIDNV